MDLRTKALLALFAVAMAGAWGWMRDRDGRLRAEGRLQVEAQRGDSLADLVEVLVVEIDSATVRMERVREESDSVVQEAEAKVDSIRRHRPAVVDTVAKEAGADSTVVREAVERVAATYEAEIEQKDRRDERRLAVITAQAGQIAALQAERTVNRQLIASLRAQIRDVQSTRPGWLERNTSKGLLVAGGIVAGFITAEVIR